MAEILEVTGENWDAEVLQSPTPVLVDFWAPWCGPCKRIAPTVDAVAEEVAGRVKVAKLNVDDAQEIATRYRVMSIPTLLLFKDGQVVADPIANLSREGILQKLQPHMEPGGLSGMERRCTPIAADSRKPARLWWEGECPPEPRRSTDRCLGGRGASRATPVYRSARGRVPVRPVITLRSGTWSASIPSMRRPKGDIGLSILHPYPTSR